MALTNNKVAQVSTHLERPCHMLYCGELEDKYARLTCISGVTSQPVVDLMLDHENYFGESLSIPRHSMPTIAGLLHDLHAFYSDNRRGTGTN